MKKLFYLFICAAVASVSLTSCLSDDDDDKNTSTPLTPQEKAEQMAAMAGTYSGYLFFINDTTLKADSVSLEWQVTAADSILTVRGIPVKVLAQNIPHADTHKMLEESEATISITSTLHPYKNEIEETSYYTFWNVPTGTKAEYNILDANDNSHQVIVEFMQQVTQINSYGYYTYYSIGEYYQKKLLSYCIVKSVTVDGSTYTVNNVMYVYGNKMF